MKLEFTKIDFETADQSHERQADLSVQSDSNSAERRDNPLEFRPSDFVVYPAHGVGQILAIEVQTVAGACLEYFAIYFAKSKLRLHVPTRKAPNIGMRKLSSSATIEQARLTLSEAPRRVRGNWSRWVNEYEAKIKTGDILALAEATRDLYRRSANSEQSYSERQLYTAALHRLAEEVAIVEGITEENAVSELEGLLLSRLNRTQ
jgi:CarD family transcriptional regulator, regulator of rRNA transcription